MKKTIAVLLVFCFCDLAIAQRRYYKKPKIKPSLTYDLGLSFGSYNNSSYTEITFGVNYKIFESIVWRNAAFTRMGNTENILGLDTSLRYVFDTNGDGGPAFHFFAGPGYRIANERNSGPLIEAGLIMKSNGFAIGGGFKTVIYNDPGKKSDGSDLPKQDTILFILLGAGGAF